MQWRGFVDAQWRAARALRGETKDLALALVARPHRRARRRTSTTARRWCTAASIHGLVPKEKLPTYNVFYEARTFAPRRAPACTTSVARRALRRPGLRASTSAASRSRSARTSGRPTGRCAVAATPGAELVRQPLGVALPPRRRRHAARDDRHARRRQPVHRRLREPRRRQRRPRLRRRRLRRAERAPGARARRASRGLRGGRRSTSIARARLRTENTTWRTDQEALRGERAAGTACARHRRHRARRERLALPGAAAAQLLLAGAERAALAPRASFCEDLLDALALGVGDYFEKTGVFKTIGVALSGGRDSLLCLLIARRYVDRATPPRRESRDARRARCCARSSCRRATRRRRRARRRAGRRGARRAARRSCRSTRPSSASSRRRARCCSRARSSRRWREQNVQARVRAAAHVELGELRRRASSCRPSNMSEKAVGYTTIGGDMEGALAVIANVPKTVVNYLLDYLLETHRAREAIRLTLAKPASRRARRRQEDEKDLMPFPVLDACFALYAGEKMAPSEVRRRCASMFPEHDAGAAATRGRRKFARLFTAVDLQVGAGAAVAPRRQPRSRPRARAAAAGGAAQRVARARIVIVDRTRSNEDQ